MIKKMLLFVFTSLILSCSKPDNKPETPDVCMIKSLEAGHNNNVVTPEFYTYDNKSRVVRIDYGVSASSDFMTFQYNSDKIVVKSSRGGEFTYNLNSKGHIVQVFNTTYQYNGDGYIIGEKTTFNNANSTSTRTFTYRDGNLIQIEDATVFNGVTRNSKTILEYSEDKFQSLVGRANPTFQGEWPVLSGFYGTHSKQLVSKIITTDSNLNTVVTTFSYQKDSTGKIVSITRNWPGNTEEVKINYSCE